MSIYNSLFSNSENPFPPTSFIPSYTDADMKIGIKEEPFKFGNILPIPVPTTKIVGQPLTLNPKIDVNKPVDYRGIISNASNLYNPSVKVHEDVKVPLYTGKRPDTKFSLPKDDTNPPKSIYDKMRKWDAGMAGVEVAINAASAFQAINAKPTTVTAPHHVNLETPKISSDVEANLALVKENMGTAINSNIDAAKERGYDVTKYAPGLFAQAGRLMRETAGQLTGRNQDLLNQREMVNAETNNKEAMINAEMDNRYIERRDQVMAQDSAMRGQQLSQAVSNVGAISSRLMNTYMQTEMIKNQEKEDAMYANFYRQQAALDAINKVNKED